MTNKEAYDQMKYLLNTNHQYYDAATISAMEKAIKALAIVIAMERCLEELKDVDNQKP